MRKKNYNQFHSDWCECGKFTQFIRSPYGIWMRGNFHIIFRKLHNSFFPFFLSVENFMQTEHM